MPSERECGKPNPILMAHMSKFRPTPPPIPLPQAMVPTESHRAARAALLAIGELFFSGMRRLPSGVKLRLTPLVVAPTGAGKSHLIRSVASLLSANYLRITRADCVPQGSARGRPTLHRILDQLSTTDRMVLHVDEVEKFDTDIGAQDWSAAIAGDLWNLLDGLYPIAEYLRETQFPGREAPTEAEVEKWIKTRLWIVGSGTWTQVFADNRPGTTIGFQRDVEATPVGAERISRSNLISPELLHRFSSDLVFLRYPNREETARLIKSTGIGCLAGELGQTIRPESIDWSLGGLRVLETLATRLVLAQLARDRAIGSPTFAEPNGENTAGKAVAGPGPS